MAADAVDRHCADRRDEAEGDEEDTAVQRLSDAVVAHLAGILLERRQLAAVVAEQLDEQRTGNVEALGHLRVHRRVVLHLLARDVLQAQADATRRDDEEWQHAEGQQRQAPFEEEHRRQRRDQPDDVADDAAERVGDGGLGTDDVVAETRRDRPGRRPREERDRHPDHLREQGRSQVVDQRLADDRAAPPLQYVEPGIGDGSGDAENGQPRDQRSVGVGDRRVDDRPHDERRHESEQGGDEDPEDVDGEEAAIRAGECPDPS